MCSIKRRVCTVDWGVFVYIRDQVAHEVLRIYGYTGQKKREEKNKEKTCQNKKHRRCIFNIKSSIQKTKNTRTL